MNQQSASPELPDIDRLEALARAATPGEWLMHETYACNGELSGCRIVAEDGYELIGEDTGPGTKDAEFIVSANPAAVLTLIEMARRAQPEGELDDMDLRDPWVVAARKADHLCPSELSSPDRWRWKAAYMRGQLAQPEGEAHGTDGDNMMRRYGPHVKALIAAGNGPGYPKALGGLFSAITAHVRKPEGEAPQAEAFAWAVLAENGNVIIWSKNRGQVEPVAKQYGRPVVPVVALSAAHHAESGAQAGEHCDHPAFLKIMDDILTPQGMAKFNADESVNLNREFASEIFRAGLAAQSQGAHSAPGTPEAPANQDAKDAERYRALRDAKTIPAQVWNALERGEDVDEAVDLLIDLHKPIPFCEPCKAGRYNECEQVFPCVLPRAAQIDGGKGEEASHG